MKKSLKNDALSVIGGIYGMNANYAVGYMFNSTDDGKKVYNGEFCGASEIFKLATEYNFFYDFETNKFSKN